MKIRVTTEREIDPKSYWGWAKGLMAAMLSAEGPIDGRRGYNDKKDLLSKKFSELKRSGKITFVDKVEGEGKVITIYEIVD